MNADPLRAGSGGEEDSWETLAEDLFGIDLGTKPSADAPISSEDLLLDEPSPAAPPPPEAKSAAPPARPEVERERKTPERSGHRESRRPERGPSRPPRAQRTPPPDDDFGADLDLEAPFAGSREPEPEPETPPEEFSERGKSEGREPPRRRDERPREDRPREGRPREQAPASESEESSDQTPAPDESDTYWDPLKNWQWGEERESSHEPRESRGG